MGKWFSTGKCTLRTSKKQERRKAFTCFYSPHALVIHKDGVTEASDLGRDSDPKRELQVTNWLKLDFVRFCP